jgi:hypothetical protein
MFPTGLGEFQRALPSTREIATINAIEYDIVARGLLDYSRSLPKVAGLVTTTALWKEHGWSFDGRIVGQLRLAQSREQVLGACSPRNPNAEGSGNRGPVCHHWAMILAGEPHD